MGAIDRVTDWDWLRANGKDNQSESKRDSERDIEKARESGSYSKRVKSTCSDVIRHNLWFSIVLRAESGKI